MTNARSIEWQTGQDRVARLCAIYQTYAHISRWDVPMYGCQEETTSLHAISCTKTGWSSLAHNRVLHQDPAREKSPTFYPRHGQVDNRMDLTRYDWT